MVEKIHFNGFFLSNGGSMEGQREGYSYHLLILNSDSFSAKLTTAMWHNCKLKVCADGGTNRLYDSLSESERAMYIPDFIVGDLDSLRSDVAAYYQERGAVIKKVVSQNENDLDKAVLLIRSVIETGTTAYVDELDASGTIAAGSATQPQSTLTHLNPAAFTGNACIAVMGAFGGRFDQELATVSSLYRWLPVFDRMVMVGRQATACVLQPGVLHRIRCVNHANPAAQTNAGFAREGPTCGLIPVGSRVHSITTSGLQWDLSDHALQMGVSISSSNALLPDAAEVTVQTSDNVLWTVQLHEA